jgi:hypothetical protein
VVAFLDGELIQRDDLDTTQINHAQPLAQQPLIDSFHTIPTWGEVSGSVLHCNDLAGPRHHRVRLGIQNRQVSYHAVCCIAHQPNLSATAVAASGLVFTWR